MDLQLRYNARLFKREREKYLLQIGSFSYCVTEQIPTGPYMPVYVIYSHSAKLQNVSNT